MAEDDPERKMEFFSEENKQKREAIGEGIYLLYFAVMIGARAAGLYEGMRVYNILLVLGLMLFACKMLLTTRGLKEWLVAAGLMLVAGLVYISTGEKGLIVCFSMLLGMKKVSVKKVISVGILVSGILIIGKILLGITGIAPEIYYPQEREGVGLMFRHALGYAHPNTLHMNVLMLSMLVMFFVSKYIAKKNFKLLLVFSVLVLGFNFYVFQYSGSRTGVLACLVYLVVNLWFSLKKFPGILEKAVCYISYPGVCFIAILGPFILPDSIFTTIDQKVFTTRFTIARYFWENNHISLLGIRLNNPNPRYQTYGIDMAQLYLFLQLGLVAFVVISFITVFFIHESLKKGYMQELAALMGMLCLGIWEPLLYNLGFKNFTYVFMGALLYELLGEKVEDEALDISDRAAVRITGTVLRSLAAGIAAGIAIFFGVMLLTSAPTALYGDRQQDETGKTFDMEEVYLTADEVTELRSQGDIIVGYVNGETPMYKYSSEIAEMEDGKRNLSAAVWIGVLVAALYGMCYTSWEKFSRRSN